MTQSPAWQATTASRSDTLRRPITTRSTTTINTNPKLMTSLEKHRCAKLAQMTGDTYNECRDQFDSAPLDAQNVQHALAKALAMLGILETELKQLAQ